MNSPAERRRFHRFPFDAVGSIVRPGQPRVSCRIVDLSISGALVTVEGRPGLVVGEEGELAMLITGELSGGEVELKIRFKVVRLDEDQLGCYFVGADPDNFDLLKRLVERNLGKPELLDRELLQLGYWPGLQAQ